MTIGLFLSAGVIALFLGTKQSYRVNEGMARVQESGRFAIEYLARDVREAGFREFDNTAFATIDDPIIIGWQGANSDPSTEGLTTYTDDTDVFRIRYRDFNSDSSSFVTRQILYYVGPMPSGGEAPGLRQKIDADDSEELLEGVYNMQVRYGLDTNSDNQLDGYVDADYVDPAVGTNWWTMVVAVKIDLLLGSSENNLVDAPMSLPFELNDGTSPFTATDRRIYQMFSTTIALRNRLP